MTPGEERHARNAEARRRATADLRVCPADSQVCDSGICPGPCVVEKIAAEVGPTLRHLDGG